MSFFMHPSLCIPGCILRDALLYASFEVLCCMHPSRCFVVCGKNVYNFVIVITRRAKCESNVKKNVSPLSRTWLVGSLVRRMRYGCASGCRLLLSKVIMSLPEAERASFVFGKTSPPFLARFVSGCGRMMHANYL